MEVGGNKVAAIAASRKAIVQLRKAMAYRVREGTGSIGLVRGSGVGLFLFDEGRWFPNNWNQRLWFMPTALRLFLQIFSRLLNRSC